MKVYISGKVFGLDLREAMNLFEEAEEGLKQKGMEPLSPFKLYNDDFERTWEEYLIEGIKGMLTCQGIHAGFVGTIERCKDRTSYC